MDNEQALNIHRMTQIIGILNQRLSAIESDAGWIHRGPSMATHSSQYDTDIHSAARDVCDAIRELFRIDQVGLILFAYASLVKH